MPDKKNTTSPGTDEKLLQKDDRRDLPNNQRQPLQNTADNPSQNTGGKYNEDAELSDFDRHNGSAGAFEGTESGGDDDDKEDDFLKYGR